MLESTIIPITRLKVKKYTITELSPKHKGTEWLIGFNVRNGINRRVRVYKLSLVHETLLIVMVHPINLSYLRC